MPITIRNDVNPGLLPFMASYQDAQLEMQREAERRAAQMRAQQDADAARRQASAEASNARIRASRERLGAEQGPQQSTFAGANWQTPMQLLQDGKQTTLYQNQGADPLGSGAFGALGTKEQFVVDPGGAINPNDAFDRHMVAQVTAKTPSGVNNVDERHFDDQFEAEDRRRDQAQAWELAKENRARDARFIEQQRQWAEKEEFERKQEIGKQAARELAAKGDNESLIGAISTLATAEGDFEREFSPRQQKERERIIDAADKLARDNRYSPAIKNEGLKRYYKQLEEMRPMAPRKKFEQETDAEGNVWQKEQGTGHKQLLKAAPKPVAPKEQKPDFTPNQILDFWNRAEEALKKEDVNRIPTQEEIEQRAGEMMKRVQRVMGRSPHPAGEPIAPPFVPTDGPAQEPPPPTAPIFNQALPPQMLPGVQQAIQEMKARGLTPDQVRAEVAKMVTGAA